MKQGFDQSSIIRRRYVVRVYNAFPSEMKAESLHDSKLSQTLRGDTAGIAAVNDQVSANTNTVKEICFNPHCRVS